jgi:uncharacterized membrane protein SpoIIM required for sporulation
MDVDRFIATNEGAWLRLGALVRRARRSARGLAPDEVDELVQLYQLTSTHLSHARAVYGDSGLNGRLNRLVAEANAVVHGSRSSTSAAVRRFFTATFPGAVWALRRFMLASALLLFVPALVIGVWLARSPVALDTTISDEQQAAMLATEFEDYYSSEPASQYAARVTINNIQVAITAFALGILVCVGTAWILASNGANVGLAAGLFHAAGEAPQFYGLILPHGMLELTAVVLAGGAGLRLGWTIIDPGDRLRSTALREEGRRAMAVILGLVLVFISAGLIEGFVTGSGLPTFLRVGIGLSAWTAFVAYVVRYGRAVELEEAATADRTP